MRLRNIRGLLKNRRPNRESYDANGNKNLGNKAQNCFQVKLNVFCIQLD